MPHNRNTEIRAVNVPAMDRPSVAFAWFLDSIVFETEAANFPDEKDHPEMLMSCKLCGEDICEVSDGDKLRVLLNTALAHTCP